MEIKESIELVLNKYSQEKSKTFANNEFIKKVTHEIPEVMYRELQIDREKYKISASCGQSNWSTIPWIGIFDKTITRTARRGYYIVLLFNADMTGFYLSLNQGYTWFQDNFKKQKPLEKAKLIANKMKEKLNVAETEINLKSSLELPKGYEAGNILCKYYSKDSQEINQLKGDIMYMLDRLDKLKSIVGENWEEYNKNIIKNSQQTARNIEPYTKQDFLKEVLINDEEYDSIINTLKRNKNIILKGAPGVGKTYCAKRIMYSIIGKKDDSKIKMVQFHETYSYEDFVQGYRPNQDGNFIRKNGIFYDIVIEAQKELERARKKGEEPEKYCIIIDEINRGKLAKILGDTMMLIEPDKRDSQWGIKLTYSYEDEKEFYVPENLYIIGTMNIADKSLSKIDYALERRFSSIYLEPAFESDKFRKLLIEKEKIEARNVDRIIKDFTKLNKYITETLGKKFKLGHSYFINKSIENFEETYKQIIQYEIKPLLEQYYYNDEERIEEALSKLGYSGENNG